MKINKIHFQNINSLRGEHTVDFSQGPLAKAGLFAITGPTGSGKSTLLDVICLALFNQIPRLPSRLSKALIEKTGCILTRHTKEAFAEVTYTSAKGTFRSQWSISTNRNGSLRDYEMEIAQVGHQGFDIKKSDIPKKNEELIGLSYEQFIKSILLSQGDFARFLQANKNERTQLLEKITGTSIYSLLGKMAYEKNKEFQKDIETKNQRVAEYQAAVFTEEIFEEKKEQYDQLEKRQKAIRSSIERYRELIKQKEALESIRQKISTLQKQEKSQKDALKAFQETQGQSLKRHEALSQEAETLQRWQQTQKEHERISQDKKDLEAEIQQAQQAQAQVLAQAQAFTHQQLAVGQIAEAVDSFAEKVADLEDEIKQIRSDLQSQIALLTPLQKIGLKFDPKELESSQETYHQYRIATQSKLAALTGKIDNQLLVDPPASLMRLEKQIGIAQDANATVRIIADKRQTQAESASKITQLTQRIEALPSEIKVQKSAASLSEKEVENLQLQIQNQQLRASLETHRAKLIPGQPCPLCGAQEHPFSENTPLPPSDLEQQLKAAKKTRQVVSTQLTQLETEYHNTQAQVQEQRLSYQRIELDLAKLRTQLADHQQALEIADPEATDWQAVQNDFHLTRTQIAQYQQIASESELLNHAIIPINTAIELLKEGKAKKAQIQALYPGSDVRKDARKIREEAERLRQKLADLSLGTQKANEQLSQIGHTLTELQQQLQATLADKGYAHPAQALAARLPDQRYQQLNQEHQRLQANLSTTLTRLEEQQAQAKEHKDQDADTPITTLQAQQAQATKELDAQSADIKELHRQIENHRENDAKALQLKTEIKALESEAHRWVLLNAYIGDATGKKFSEFAQDLTLSQLVQLANRRLTHLQDRYLLDRPSPTEDESLVIIDQHMGRERRSVKTLSGGETFLLSLSLALALSDLASRHVEINSLFIDEGFGTLDPETLDQTLDTLEKLQSEGSKTIGIISHVTALQERIQAQIRLVRHGQGHSRLEVKA